MIDISLYEYAYIFKELFNVKYKMSKSLANTTNYLFNIQTVQSGAFRVLIEALKDILTDCNFIINETGIKLIATDSSHNVLIHMKLLAENCCGAFLAKVFASHGMFQRLPYVFQAPY